MYKTHANRTIQAFISDNSDRIVVPRIVVSAAEIKEAIVSVVLARAKPAPEPVDFTHGVFVRRTHADYLAVWR